MSYLQSVLDSGKCPRCDKKRNDIDEQYSFGAYAGVMCTDCAKQGFKDQCGHGRPMGTRQQYEEENGPGTYDDDY
jgi:hypothetical protein